MFIFTSFLTWLGNLLRGPFAEAAADADCGGRTLENVMRIITR